jgi:hypothetical protein
MLTHAIVIRTSVLLERKSEHANVLVAHSAEHLQDNVLGESELLMIVH